jgi:hypothetical protein
MKENDMHSITTALVSPRKGILAADENTVRIQKTESIGLHSIQANRRAHREMLFTIRGPGLTSVQPDADAQLDSGSNLKNWRQKHSRPESNGT